MIVIEKIFGCFRKRLTPVRSVETGVNTEVVSGTQLAPLSDYDVSSKQLLLVKLLALKRMSWGEREALLFKDITDYLVTGRGQRDCSLLEAANNALKAHQPYSNQPPRRPLRLKDPRMLTNLRVVC